MEEKVLERVKSLGSWDMDNEGLSALCAGACTRLNSLLAEGVTPEDCGEAYILAAAWLAVDWLRESGSWSGVTAVTAGNMTVRREGGEGGALTRLAMELMGPWLRERSFVFQGV